MSEKEENRTQLAKALKKMVLDFIGDLNDNVCTTTQEKLECKISSAIFSAKNEKVIIEDFILRVVPHKKEIENRDVEYFKNSKDSIFAELPADRTEYYLNKITSLDVENMKVVWSYFDAFLSICESFTK